MSDSCFELEGWDEFVERFSQFVDKWEAKKAQLLKKMGNIYHSEVIPHVPVDTSHLVSNIFVFGEGIPHDYVEVGTNVEYAKNIRNSYNIIEAGGELGHEDLIRLHEEAEQKLVAEAKQREKARAEAKRQKKEKHDFYSLLRMTDQVCR